MAIVIDSSVLVDLLVKHAHPELKRTLSEQELHAPHLIDLEFLNALRQINRLQRLDDAASWSRLEDFAAVRITRYPHAPFLPTAWRMRHNISPYDAVYVALAQSLGLPLLTADRRLARAAASLCEVIPVE